MNKLASRSGRVFGACLVLSAAPRVVAQTAATGGSAPQAEAKAETEAEAEAKTEAKSEAETEAEPATVAAAPGDPWGDAQALSVISLHALFQTRYTKTFASTSQSSRESYAVREEYLVQQGDGWQLKRAMLRISSDPVPYLGFKMVVDFAQLLDNDPEDALKQAYANLRPIPERLEFTVGLFKVPFAILELDPSSRFEFADMGPANQLVQELGFAGRDLGLLLQVAPLHKPKRLRLYVGAFGGHSYDEHDLPVGSLAGRIETKPSKSLRFGAGVVEHLHAVTYRRPFNTSGKDELPNPPDPLYPTQKRWDRGRAWGVDARFKKKGFSARGEYLYGDRVDVDERYGASTFWTAWGIVTYRIEAGSVQLIPALRAEWLDTDREHDKRGMHRTLSCGMNVLFLERVRIVADVTRTDVENNTALLNQPKPLQQQPYLALDNTRLVVQLQLEL